MSVSKIVTLKASSPISFDEAIKAGISRAHKTLKHVTGAWVKNQEVHVDEGGRITEYRVELKVTFILED
ncbi:MAG TPA: dodecin family protein [Bellilinea sp.]|nr:dodecin family protein [Bellilinea sp.]